jgi:hypothetical protein
VWGPRVIWGAQGVLTYGLSVRTLIVYLMSPTDSCDNAHFQRLWQLFQLADNIYFTLDKKWRRQFTVFTSGALTRIRNTLPLRTRGFLFSIDVYDNDELFKTLRDCSGSYPELFSEWSKLSSDSRIGNSPRHFFFFKEVGFSRMGQWAITRLHIALNFASISIGEVWLEIQTACPSLTTLGVTLSDGAHADVWTINAMMVCDTLFLTYT